MKRALAIVLALASVGLAAQDLSIKPYGLRTKWWVVPTGADATATYSLPSVLDGRQTLLFSKFGGGYEDRNLFRDQATGDPLAVDAEEIAYTWANFQWELAFVQGLIPGGGKAPGGYDADLLEVFVFYRGRFDRTLDGYGDTAAFADWDQLLYTGAMAGLSWNGLLKDERGCKSGLYAEATLEYAPGALNADLADFWRASAKAIGALPLFGAEDALLRGYLIDFASVDYVDGSAIPAYVNQSFGGRVLRDALGDCVRGYVHTAYDTKFKAVNNLELRVNGPMFLKKTLYPIAFAFVDAGYYADYAGATSAHAEDSGYLASVGGGVACSIIDLVQLGVVVAQPLVETDEFYWAIELFLHF